MSNTLTCDFCSDRSRTVVYEYRTQGDFRLARGNSGHPVAVVVHDDGRWAACALCAYLIETRQPAALLQEIIDSALESRAAHSAPNDGLRSTSQKVMDFFWQKRLPGRLAVIDNDRSDPITDREMRDRIGDLANSLGLA